MQNAGCWCAGGCDDGDTELTFLALSLLASMVEKRRVEYGFCLCMYSALVVAVVEIVEVIVVIAVDRGRLW